MRESTPHLHVYLALSTKFDKGSAHCLDLDDVGTKRRVKYEGVKDPSAIIEYCRKGGSHIKFEPDIVVRRSNRNILADTSTGEQVLEISKGNTQSFYSVVIDVKGISSLKEVPAGVENIGCICVILWKWRLVTRIYVMVFLKVKMYAIENSNLRTIIAPREVEDALYFVVSRRDVSFLQNGTYLTSVMLLSDYETIDTKLGPRRGYDGIRRPPDT
ncbi:3228_t:CDS:2 [Diversispora eburnea]|uniref:3228_t:CDS:1 n=1 Tax=Diversispora eburnea TaxID=1213867 RepID=A0A9N8ZXU6_9GLOM|nr:3228_t:CDS:2 [Diversispora eburnea]